ncbi:LysR family transcriptional regulator [Pseudorhodoplanes sp.]|uniref:LysR family transcriptional regulator n=1 Tax=Pseudorhodoplanes sp. TaxID=1934341 RepID=UPI00391B1B2D
MNLRSIDLNLLVAFDALVSEQSASKAAAKLGVTQPAVSHALKRLRDLFKDELLVRGPHGMQPTGRALSLHPQVQSVLADIRSIVSSGAEFEPATTERTFRLSMSDAMSVEALPSIVRRIRREAPRIDLVISTSGPQESCQRIADDEIDLAIGVFPHVPKDLFARELYRDTLICVADKRNPRLKNQTMTLQDYLESPHVTVARFRDTGIQVDEILDSMGIPRRIVVAVPHYLSIPSLIRGTDLVAHTRRRLLSVFRLTSDLVVFPVPLPMPVPELEFIQIWHKRYEGDPGHRWLRDLVLDAVRRKAS